MTGAQLGAYRVLYQIGEGSMGSVWLAQHAMLGCHAAIKILHPAYAGQEDQVSRFFNEARAATAIRDPGIVRVYDFGRHSDGSAFIVMELLEGEPLDRRLARVGTLDVRDALRIARQLASALAAAHARGIIHRDLKPENIFLVRDPEVAGGERAKLLDFGVAKLTGAPPMTRAYAVVGTPVYMAPEQCAGIAVDHRCDLYALGGVLFTLLTGAPPFGGLGMLELIAQHMLDPPQPPSRFNLEVPPEVDALVLRCLAKDPAVRFATAHELALAIGSMLARSTLPAYEVPTLIGPPPLPPGPVTVRLPEPPPGAITLRLETPPPRHWLAGVTALAVLSSAIAFTIALSGCQSLVGIEDFKTRSDAATDADPTDSTVGVTGTSIITYDTGAGSEMASEGLSGVEISAFVDWSGRRRFRDDGVWIVHHCLDDSLLEESSIETACDAAYFPGVSQTAGQLLSISGAFAPGALRAATPGPLPGDLRPAGLGLLADLHCDQRAGAR